MQSTKTHVCNYLPIIEGVNSCEGFQLYFLFFILYFKGLSNDITSKFISKITIKIKNIKFSHIPFDIELVQITKTLVLCLCKALIIYNIE